MKVFMQSGGQIFGSLFLIDGVQAGAGGDETLPINGVQTEVAGAGYDSTKLSNGPHTVQFLGFADSNQTIAAVTPSITIQVSNTISSDSIVSDWFDPTQGELCYLSATAPAGSTWTVQATSADGATIIRTWQGASSLIKLAWDGKDASGNPLPISDYALQLTVQPPGNSPQGVSPLGAKNTQAAPNAAGVAKKTHPIKMLQGQPIGLAFISIGASYYLDNNKIPVESPAQDILLSTVVSDAYTTLFGAGNFQIVRSDTFQPYDVDAKGITNLAKIEGYLGTAQVFYLFGHGAGIDGPPGRSQTPRSTIFGDFDHKESLHMDFFPSPVAFNLSDFDIVVPTYVKTNNYVFAWNDSCNSAGGDSNTGVIGKEDDTWATAFNATTFIGNNGYGIVNNDGTSSPTATSPWYTWRKTFWGQLALGQPVNQAYLNCWGPLGVNTTTYDSHYTLQTTRYECTPGDGYGSTPRVLLYGDIVNTTLVPQ